MKVKELIVELQKFDPEKEVMIQQGEEFDYMTVETVRAKELIYWDKPDEDETDIYIVIEYS